MKYLMGCGHVSNATKENGESVCVICYKITDDAEKIICECTDNIGLECRVAKCSYCGKETESNWDLPFFEYRPEHDCDKYYDGCKGWS